MATKVTPRKNWSPSLAPRFYAPTSPSRRVRDDHAAYIASWIAVLQNDSGRFSAPPLCAARRPIICMAGSNKPSRNQLRRAGRRVGRLCCAMALLRFIEIDGRRYLWRDCMFEGTRIVFVANFGKVCSACNSRLPRTRAWSIQQHGSPTLPPTSNNRARRRDTASHCVAITHRKPRIWNCPDCRRARAPPVRANGFGLGSPMDAL